MVFDIRLESTKSMGFACDVPCTIPASTSLRKSILWRLERAYMYFGNADDGLVAFSYRWTKLLNNVLSVTLSIRITGSDVSGQWGWPGCLQTEPLGSPYLWIGSRTFAPSSLPTCLDNSAKLGFVDKYPVSESISQRGLVTAVQALADRLHRTQQRRRFQSLDALILVLLQSNTGENKA